MKIAIVVSIGLIVTTILAGISHFVTRTIDADQKAILFSVSKTAVHKLVAYRKEHGCLPTRKADLLAAMGSGAHFSSNIGANARLIDRGNEAFIVLAPSEEVFSQLSADAVLEMDSYHPFLVDSYRISEWKGSYFSIIRLSRCEDTPGSATIQKD